MTRSDPLRWTPQPKRSLERTNVFREAKRHFQKQTNAPSGTLTIPAGQLIRTIAVTVRGDRKREPDEVFYMNLGNSAGATIVDGQGVGTLRSDDR